MSCTLARAVAHNKKEKGMKTVWGSMEVLEKDKNSLGGEFCVKKLVIDSGHRLSLQKHYHRNEIWHIVSGVGIITHGNEEIEVGIGNVVSIEKGVVHRAENREARMKLVIIEVSYGKHVHDEDIIRIEDDYGRV